jgi:hypothetical protein
MTKKEISNTGKKCKKTTCSKTRKNKRSTKSSETCDSEPKHQEKTLWQKIKSWFV